MRGGRRCGGTWRLEAVEEAVAAVARLCSSARMHHDAAWCRRSAALAPPPQLVAVLGGDPQLPFHAVRFLGMALAREALLLAAFRATDGRRRAEEAERARLAAEQLDLQSVSASSSRTAFCFRTIFISNVDICVLQVVSDFPGAIQFITTHMSAILTSRRRVRLKGNLRDCQHKPSSLIRTI